MAEVTSASPAAAAILAAELSQGVEWSRSVALDRVADIEVTAVRRSPPPSSPPSCARASSSYNLGHGNAAEKSHLQAPGLGCIARSRIDLHAAHRGTRHPGRGSEKSWERETRSHHGRPVKRNFLPPGLECIARCRIGQRAAHRGTRRLGRAAKRELCETAG